MDVMIDLRALLVEREDCDSGTVSKLREGLAQGGGQFNQLRDAASTLEKRLPTLAGDQAKKIHLKLGIIAYFMGQMTTAADHLEKADTPLSLFYLGKARVNLHDYEGALAAFDKAEAAKYSEQQVRLQRAGVYRQLGDLKKAAQVLEKLGEMSSHSAEYHFQLAGVHQSEGERLKAIEALENAVELDPGHTGALFQLAYENDLAGNDEEAIEYYEQCVKYPPVSKGALNNLGVLYEDNERYKEAVECYNRLLKADPLDERARLFLKDAGASLNMYYSPDDETSNVSVRQLLETPVTDFELSVRARNCLKKMNIRTLGDLTRVTEQQLLAAKNFGDTSLEELRAIMQAKGMRIGQSIEQGSQHEMRMRPQSQNLSAEEQAILNKDVSELNLSVRARKCMTRLNIKTFGDLVSRSSNELLEAKNFGVTSLTEVREKLTGYGLKLRGD